MLRPARRQDVSARVMTALAHFYVAAMPEGIHQQIAADWADALGEFPMWAIAEAFRKHLRTEDRKPTIAAIRSRCQDLTANMRRRRDRLQRLSEAA
ncbi:hypothetical protein F1188_11105 [Roseospira marina]|uniref:Uncharacterized protein n=1 Tax=Roseospira marina TaxID=140057 RepID=A0A5M6IB29_9PROT|nr:hypothetical protein [Roseospira marina]KAA5605441.1 hypothetical protein F1188_11105 [Roseospira marina]MBB4314563.1 hypothetical protein [Roseospira marina]MBB5088875.1 hypothetical protein [Roseospira marina]